MLPALALVVLSASPAPLKVALMPLSGGEGVPEKMAQSITDALAAEVRRVPGVQLMTRDQLTAVLSVERQKQLMGCQSDSCMGEIAGALDVDRLVVGSVAKLGASWILHLQLMDARKGATLQQSDRRRKGGTVDDVLDDLPGMTRELFGAAPATPAEVPAATAPPRPPHAAAPASTLEVPYGEVDRSKLKLVEDGAGHAIAFVPFGGLEGPVFYSSGGAFHALRIAGGGSQGDRQFDLVFWEPRARVPAEASFDLREGHYSVTCGKTKLSFKRPADEKAKLEAAKLMKPLWARRIYALARDDEGDYFYVDRAREPDDNKDFRVYLGQQGEMEPVPTKVIASDSGGDVLGTPNGKLRLALRSGEAEWIPPAGRQKLQLLDAQDNARLVYGALGVYRNQALGTPCDGSL